MKSSKNHKRPFIILSRRRIFTGKVLSLEMLQVKVPSGQKVERSLIKSRGVAVIIPLLPKGRLILVRQLRVATGKAIWEFPAGTLEKGEPIVRCANRELEEETGWRAGRIRKVLEYFPTPGVSDEKMHLFIADRLKEGTHHKPDADEELEVRIFPITQVQRMIKSREIIDGKTLLGFFYLQTPLCSRS